MKLILGTAQLGMNYGIQGTAQPNIRQVLEILNTAYGAGICIFDTASAYGSAEEVLGEFLKQPEIDITKINIISKFNSDLEELEASIIKSMERLGIKSLEGYLFHNGDYIFEPTAVTALKELKEKALTRKIGISIYTPIQAMKALEYDYIDIIQVPYNVFDRRLDACGFFKQAKEKGKTIQARSALLQGLLMMEPEQLPAHMTFAVPYLKKFLKVCRENGLRPFDAAVQYVLQHDLINYLVFGVDSLDHLKQFITTYSQCSKTNIRPIFESNFNVTNDRLVMPNLW